MYHRKIYKKLKQNIYNKKIVVLMGARQVGKTTILKELHENIEEPKLFLNLEIRDYHKHFASYQEIIKLLAQNGFSKGKRFYLFLDEFQKVENVTWIIKSLFDRHNNIKIFASGSSSLGIEKTISDSLAGRKRVFQIYPLDFEEFSIWKAKEDPNNIQNFLTNPLNKPAVESFVDEFLTYGGFPELVLAKEKEEKTQVLADIFDYWFHRDILPNINKQDEFYAFMRELGFRMTHLLELSEIARNIGVSVPTCKHYLMLLTKSLLIFPIRPFFSNKLKEITKAPKTFFVDNGFRNFLIRRFNYSEKEKGELMENLVFTELIKHGLSWQEIRFWHKRVGGRFEVDLILENEKKAYEVKYSKEESKSLRKFLEDYPDFSGRVITKDNFYQELYTEGRQG